ncbi:MAG: transglutaminase TgpA family protein [Acidimicrobiales bacterium]
MKLPIPGQRPGPTWRLGLAGTGTALLPGESELAGTGPPTTSRAHRSFPGASASLVALVLVAAAGFGRSLGLTSRATLAGLAAAAGLGLLSWACRRLRVPATGLVITLGVGLAASWLVLGDATWYGLPTAATASAAAAAFGDLTARTAGISAPGEARGLALMVVIVVGFSAYLADHAAFRMRAPLVSLVPPLTLLVGGAAPARGQGEALAAGSFVVASLVFMAAYRRTVAGATLDRVPPTSARPGRADPVKVSARRRRGRLGQDSYWGPASLPAGAGWTGHASPAHLGPRLSAYGSPGDQGRAGAGGPRWGTRLGGATVPLACVVLAGGLLAGPRLPGSGEGPLVGRQESGGLVNGTGDLSPDRATLDPLVDISANLRQRSGLEMFTVQASAPRYWRVTTLDSFDGIRWSSSGAPDTPAGPAPVTAASTSALLQRVAITGLAADRLPAASQASAARGIDLADRVGLDRATGDVVSRGALAVGAVYEVESTVVETNGAELRSLGSPPLSVDTRLLELPAGVSPRIRSEARRVTANARSAYDQALALQAYFRQGFVYDEAVNLGQPARALDQFVFSQRRGFCQQFSTAFAVMARAVGLPARVVVGFTPGEKGVDNTYRVRGVNAHAWPEVHIPGAGWLAFEPTPGRGQPGAEAWTGVPPAQAAPPSGVGRGDATPAPTVTTTPPSTPSTNPPPTTAVGSPTTQPPPPTTVPPDPSEQGSSDADGPPSQGSAKFAGRLGLGVLATCLALVLGVAPLVSRWRRARRRRAANSAAEQVVVAWAEATEALARVGLGRTASETVAEHSRRVAESPRLPPGLAPIVDALAGWASEASYAEAMVTSDVAARARAATDEVVTAVGTQLGLIRRVGSAVDPRPLVSAAARDPG